MDFVTTTRPYRRPLFIATLMLLFAAGAQAQEWLYTVRPGDNIWNLTEQYLIDMRYWRSLQTLNKVADPENLPPGMRLRIPVAWLRTQPAGVRVVSVQGEVKVTQAADGRTLPLNATVNLRSGDAIRTGGDSNAILEFADGSRLTLQADGHLVLDTISAFGDSGMVDTRLRLQQGRVNNQVRPEAGVGRYEIRTPAAITAVRGTEYRVGMNPADERARAEVLQGQVVVTGGKRSRNVPAGFGTVAAIGQPPAPPVRLLPPPEVAALPEEVGRVPIQLKFPALAGAVAYRVQIAPTADFANLLFDRQVTAPQVRGPDLPDGDYIVRIRGIDAQGLEGRDGDHRLRVNARPEPPVLLEPQNESTVRQAIPTFQWTEPEQAVAYRFQLADNADFRTPLIDTTEVTGGRLTLAQALPPGVYFWRVATRDESGEQGGFGDTQGFTLRPAPPTPQLQEPEVAADTMVFRWSAGLPGQQYDFQLAADPDFSEIVAFARTSEPQVTIPRPPSGVHFLRIRAIDTDGYAAPFGTTQRINVPPASYWPLGLFALIALALAL